MSEKIINNSLIKLRTPRVEGGPTAELSGARLEDVLNDKTLSSMIKEVYTQPEINRIRVISNELKKLDIARVRGDVQGALDPFKPNSVITVLARVIGARLGSRIGGVSAGGQLQSAQIGSSRFLQFVERLTGDKAQEIMLKALEDKVVHHRTRNDVVSKGLETMIPFGKVKTYDTKTSNFTKKMPKGLASTFNSLEALHAHKLIHFK